MPEGKPQVRRERRGAVALVTIDRPEVRNALSRRAMEELDEAARWAAGDPSVRSVVLTGAGDKAFVAGADISELKAKGAPVATRDMLLHQGVLNRLERLGKPSVAAVGGYALGGGLELALACTFRVAARGSRLGFPEIQLGLIPGWGGIQRALRLAGRSRTLDLVLSGRIFEAEEGERLGLVDRLTEPGRALDEALAWATDLASKPSEAVRAALEAVERGLSSPLGEALVLDGLVAGELFETDDAREGMAAFLEKRPPRFR